MSIAFAFHAGAYVMVATDTRTTWFDEDDEPIHWIDDDAKVIAADGAVIAGVGASVLLGALHQALAGVRCAQDALRIIAAERARFARDRSLPLSYVKKGLSTTNVFVGFCNASAQRVRLFCYLAGKGHALNELEPGTVHALLPVDDDGERPDAWPADFPPPWEAFTEALRYCRTGASLEAEPAASMEFNAAHLAQLVGIGADRFPPVVGRVPVVVALRADGRVQALSPA